MRHGERKLVFARFRENAGNGVRGDVLELVYVEIEWRVRRTRIIRARERRHKEFPDNDESEQIRILLAETALGKIDEQNLFRIHHLAEF